MASVAPRRFAAALLVALALTSCGGTTEPPPPPPPPPPTISVSPTSLALVVGETGQLNASVTGSTSSVTWVSSEPAIATVSPTGLVTAAAVGPATITASLANQPNVAANASVTVTAPPVSVGITGVTQNGAAVTLSNVQGTVSFDLDLRVPPTFNGSVRVKLGGTVVASRPIVNGVVGGPAQVAPPATANATVNESILTPTTSVSVVGQEVFERSPNGANTSVIELLNSLPAVVASQPGPTLTLNNPTQLVVIDGRLTGQTVTVGNQTWGNSISLVMGSANYGQGNITKLDAGEIERIQVLSGPAGKAIFGGDAVGGVINFILRPDVAPAAGGTLNIGEGEFGFTKATVTTGQGTFVTGVLNNDPVAGVGLPQLTWNIDQRAPTMIQNRVTFFGGASFAWLNQNELLKDRAALFGFPGTGSNPAVTDQGTGVADCWFRYGTSPNTWEPNTITKGGDIGFETLAPNLYARAYCKDGFGNEAFAPVTNGVTTTYQLLGTDFGLPALTFQDNRGAEDGIGNYDLNPTIGTPLLYTGTDSRSGLSAFGTYRYRFLRAFEGATEAQKCHTGTFQNGMCQGLLTTADKVLPSLNLAGEYEFQVGAHDRAINFSGYLSRWAIDDRINPTASGLSLDQTLMAGLNFAIGWKLDDNLEVGGTAFALKYAGVTRVPILRYETQGTPFDGQWKVSAQVQYQMKFPASLEQLIPNGPFHMPSGTERKVSDLLYGGHDTGLNAGWNTVDLTSRVTSNFTSFRVGGMGLDRIEFRQPLARVCYNPYGAQGNCQGVPESMTINIDSYYPTGGISRIDEIYLAKGSIFAGLSTGLLFGQPMTASRQTFGGFFVDTYTQTLAGMRYLPGNYELLYYAFDAQRNMLEGRGIPYQVTMANFVP